ncbi:glycosyltransferase family 4 protein [Microbacterium sp.]|uniref:glycosyltransferase family 4 protein n=1 Tax=Microbacterium sp. TaxID=51671 RepID=UPI0039E36D05
MSNPTHTPHVLHLDHSTEYGGAELALQRLLSDQDRGWDASLLIPRGLDEGVFHGLSAKNVKIVRAGRPQKPGATQTGLLGAMGVAADLLRNAYAIRKTINFDLVDVVHANSTRSAVYGAIALTGHRTPFVVHLRDRIEAAALGRIGLLAFRLLSARRATTYIANSAATAETIRPLLRGRQSVAIIPSAIGVRRASSSRTPADGRLRFGMVARLDDWKGQDLLIEAFAISGLDTEASLVFYGDAAFGKESYAAKLRQQVASLGLNNVQFLGFTHDIETAIDSIDVCIQYSSRPEPLGQNVLQYLARGRVVIASDEGGPAEWVSDNSNGLLVKPRDPQALAKALKLLADSPEIRTRLSAAALATADLPTDESIARQHARVFRAPADGNRVS